MKTLLLATVAAVGLSTAAGAADLSRRMPVKAPPVAAPVPIFTWTGCYIGAHVGGGWAHKQWSDPDGTIFDAGTVFVDHDPDGFLGGGQIGCDYQTGPWVFGLEGQASWADLKKDSNFDIPTLIGPITVTGSSKINFIATVTGRVGYAFDRALIYAKGGVAWTHDEFSVFRTSGALAASASDTPAGWTVGAGLEYAFAPNWSAKVEYNFIDFGKNRTTFSCTVAAAGICDTAPIDIDQQIHTVKLGVNWRWNAAAPVVAKY